MLTSLILDCSHLCGVSFLFLRAPTLRGESLRAPGLMSRRKSADETKKPFDAEELRIALQSSQAVLDGVEAKVQLVCQQQFQQLIDAQLKPLLSQVLAAKADPPAAAAPVVAPEKKHDLLQDFANKHARAAQAAMGAPSARGRRGSIVSSDEELYDDLAPEVVEASTERLAPEMLKRVKKYGSVEAWVRFQPKWDARSLARPLSGRTHIQPFGFRSFPKN